MTRIYIAGGSSEAELVADYIARARAVGLEVTYNWTRDVLAHRAAGSPPLDPMQRLSCALADMKGIDAARIVWWIVPARMSEGASWEAGFALGRGNKITVASGPTAAHHRIFPALCDEVHPDHETAFARIVTIVREAQETASSARAARIRVAMSRS